MPTDPENLLKTTDSEQLPDDNPFHWGGDAANGEDQEKGGDDSVKAVNAEIRRVFDLYDTSKDGLLSREEFLAAVTLRLREGEKKSEIDSAQLKRQANKIYDDCDTDKNGMLDFEEFTAGYVKIESFLSDANKKGRLVEKVTHVAKQLPGGAAIKFTETMAMAAASTANEFQEKPKDNESTPLNPSASGEMAAEQQDPEEGPQNCILLIFGCLLMMVPMILMIAPTVLLCVGWFSGQSCDQPLDTFCQQMIILSLSLTFLQVMTTQTMEDEPKASAKMALLGCVQFALIIWVLVVFIQGCMAFDGAGGFGSPDGTCSTKAPLLYDMVWWYFFLLVVSLCIAPALLCCLFCCMVAFNINETNEAHLKLLAALAALELAQQQESKA